MVLTLLEELHSSIAEPLADPQELSNGHFGSKFIHLGKREILKVKPFFGQVSSCIMQEKAGIWKGR